MKHNINNNPQTLSTGALTFLFTDLEGSTRLWEQFPQAMKAALERHDALLRAAVEGANGRVIKTTGDGLMAVFASTLDGVNACLAAQLGLLHEPWGETGALRVRMGLHSGEAQPRGGDYFGPAVNRAARVMAAAHGGQILLSSAAAILTAGQLPPGTDLRDLGEHRLKDLERPEHIFQLLNPDLAADFPPLATLDRRPNNLPAQPTALIGRETELAEIVTRLSTDGVRLVTLTGPGGIGKTRTSLQAAAELIDRFEDGVYFIDLAPIRDPESVPTVIAQTIGLRENSDRPVLEVLKEQLRPKTTLLLLDNFEQVTGATPAIVELLQACPRLKLLVTSREALRVRGEQVYPIAPLGLPEAGTKKLTAEQLAQYEAVRLFIERAQAVKPEFQLTDDNAAVVAEICTRVDGLPLAIELAAARIRLFSPQALLERLGSRLSLLRGGARDLPARQQALRDTIGWSYELLDAGEQYLFVLLSVFPGGCSFEAIEQVVDRIELPSQANGDVLEQLSSLVDKSLARLVEQKSGESRLLMLETIREFATDRLDAQPELQAAAYLAHAAYYADFSERQWVRLTGSQRELALEELVSDIENVRAAWRYWLERKDLERLGKFVDSLWLLFDMRGWYHATVDLTTDLLGVLSVTPSTPEIIQQEIVLRTSLARALLATKGYTPEVEEAFTHVLELSKAVGDVSLMFPVLRSLYSFYTLRGEFKSGIPIGTQILDLARRQNDGNMQVEGHLILGTGYAFTGNVAQGLEQMEKGIALIDPHRHRSSRFRIGNYPGVSNYTASAMILWMMGYPDRALQRGLQAVELAKTVNHPYSLAYALYHVGFIYHWRREVELSLSYAQTLLEVAERQKFQIWHAVGTCLHGSACAALGKVEEGMLQMQWGMELYQGLKSPPVFWPLLRSLQAEVCLLAGKPEQGLAYLDEVMALPAEGYTKVMTVDTFRTQGDLLLASQSGNEPKAELCYLIALEIAQEFSATMLELRSAISLARLWRETEKNELGRKLLGAAYAKMTEGFETVDLIEARELLG